MTSVIDYIIDKTFTAPTCEALSEGGVYACLFTDIKLSHWLDLTNEMWIEVTHATSEQKH